MTAILVNRFTYMPVLDVGWTEPAEVFLIVNVAEPHSGIVGFMNFKMYFDL